MNRKFLTAVLLFAALAFTLVIAPAATANAVPIEPALLSANGYDVVLANEQHPARIDINNAATLANNELTNGLDPAPTIYAMITGNGYESAWAPEVAYCVICEIVETVGCLPSYAWNVAPKTVTSTA